MKAILALIALAAVIVTALLLIAMALSAIFVNDEDELDWEKIYQNEWEHREK
jgi:hypothetical protein